MKAGEKGTTEDEMVGWHHQLNGHEFEQALENNEGQGNLACCSPQGCQELDTNEWLNNNTAPREIYNFLQSVWGHPADSSSLPQLTQSHNETTVALIIFMGGRRKNSEVKGMYI